MAWLVAIARNAMFTAAEKMKRMGQLIPLDAEDDPGDVAVCPDEEAAESQTIESIWKAIVELPAQQRQCLVLRVRDEPSYEEIAETLRLSLKTVRNHLALAKANLRRVLGTEPEGNI